MGLVMILTGVLGLVSDIATNLVSTALHDSRCSFNTAVVVSDDSSSQYPSPYGTAALFTQAAQLGTVLTFDLNNRNGMQGIYRGFDPSAIDFFFATEDDIAGFWQCEVSSPMLIFEDQSDQDIARNLVSEGYIYQTYGFDALTSAGPSRQLVVISASSNKWGDPWNLKVAVDMEDDDKGSSKHMQVRTCTLEAIDPLVNNIRNNINITKVIDQWGPFFQSSLYTGFDSDHPDGADGTDLIDQSLQLLLNSIIMVAGSQNSVNKDSGSSKYGCLHHGSWINYGIVALVFLVCSMVFSLLLYWACLEVKLVRFKRQYDQGNIGQVIDSNELCNGVPNSILDWIIHAAHESDNNGRRLKHHHHLRKWLLSTRSHAGRRVGLMRKDGDCHGAPASRVASPDSALPNNTFFSQKTGYDAVRTSETWIPNP